MSGQLKDSKKQILSLKIIISISLQPDCVNLWDFKQRLFELPVSEFNAFKPRLKSPKNRF